MTTICTNGRAMAGDTLATLGSEPVRISRQKVHRLSDGRIVGVAGASGFADRVLRWVERGAHVDDAPKATGPDGYSVLVLEPNGRVTYCDSSVPQLLEVGSPAAIGSGREYALGAMAAGATPEAAVAIASRLDVYSGGVVISMNSTDPATGLPILGEPRQLEAPLVPVAHGASNGTSNGGEHAPRS